MQTSICRLPCAGLAASSNAITRTLTCSRRSMNIPGFAHDDLSALSLEEQRTRKREWNRSPLSDLFPRIPANALEQLLDIVIDKGFTYNFSQSKFWNARRYTSIVVAHVRHFYTGYDKLLRDGIERYEARKQTGPVVWKVLREWCPWDDSNEALERCFKATLLTPEERDPTWDPMDVDDDMSDWDPVDDPMDLD